MVGSVRQLNPLATSASLQTPFLACLFDKNPPHGFRSGREEVAPAFPVRNAVHVNQTEIRLMHERSALQSMIRPFAGHLGCGQFAQFIIDERKEFLRCGWIAGFDLAEDVGDVGHSIQNTVCSDGKRDTG